MGEDSQTVPVTVTVQLPRQHPAGHPGGTLPFTGAPFDVMATAGLLLGLAGAALVAAVRRAGISTDPQSADPRSSA